MKTNYVAEHLTFKCLGENYSWYYIVLKYFWHLYRTV